VTYDPATELLMAVGTPESPVHVYQNSDRGEATFEKVWIDTRTNEVKRVQGLIGQVRQ
jgi:hypothetical protein